MFNINMLFTQVTKYKQNTYILYSDMNH